MQSLTRVVFEIKMKFWLRKATTPSDAVPVAESSSTSKWNFDGEKLRRQAKQSQSRIFFEKKDEAFIHKGNLKTQILSRMSRFIRDGAIQLKAKFALANLMCNTINIVSNLKSGYLRKKNSLNGYF